MARPRLAPVAVDGDRDRDRPWQSDARVVRLTAQIKTLQHAAATTVVKTIVQIGDRLQQIHDRLSRGQWQRWCATEVPWSKSTIANYLALSKWAAAHPAEVSRLQHLGPTKLYMLMPLTAVRRRKLTGRAALAIPGRPDKKTIDTMTVAELGRVIGDDLHTPPLPRVPIGKMVQSLQHKVAGLDASAELLIARADEVDADDAAALHAAVVAIADELAAAFGL